MSSDPPSIWHRAPMLLTLWLLMFTVSSQFLVVAPILTDITEALGIAEESGGWLITGYAVAVATCALMAGPISDRFGRRLILRVGTTWMAVALLLHGLADSFGTLLALRILAGTASGMLSGAGVAYIGDVMPYKQRGQAMGILMSGMALGQVFGIPAGKILASWGGYTLPFMAFGGVMIVASALTFITLEKPTVATTTGLTLSRAIGQYKSILSNRPLVILSLASLTMMLSVSAFIVYQPTWLENTLGATDWQIASLFMVGGIGNAIGGPIAGRVSDSIGRKGLVVGASVVLAVMFVALALVPNVTWAYPIFFITMFAVGVRMGPLNAWMTALVDSKQRGSLMSLTMATGQAGFALGSAGAGPAYTSLGFMGNALFAAVGALVTAGLLLTGVPEPSAEEAERKG